MKIESNRSVYYWLMAGCFLIMLMVIIGGITRLTQSGLSMVEWKPIVGAIPPLSNEQWIHEFELYKKTPEYKVYNDHFNLSDFKRIFFWEYLHRLIGRIIGLVFIIPGLIFWIKGRFSKEMKKRVLIIFLGGILQGVLGWVMVKSGLVKNPHVSHYRLAAHLIMALGLIIYIYWTALIYLHGDEKLKNHLIPKKIINGFILLVSIQIFFGALVAGLKAGKMFNTFPKMGESWFPKELKIGFENKGILALTEDHSVVQLIHRIFGVIILILAFYVFFKIKRFHFTIQKSMLLIVFLIFIQVILGVSTLLLSVPLGLGVLHQCIAIFILLTIYYLKFKAQIEWKSINDDN